LLDLFLIKLTNYEEKGQEENRYRLLAGVGEYFLFTGTEQPRAIVAECR
jgi:hypothetical protein